MAPYRDSFSIYVDLNYPWMVAYGLEQLASLACAGSQWQRPARLYAAAAAQHAAMGIAIPPARRATWDADIAAIHARLTDEQFQSAWDSGASMSFADVVTYALESSPAPLSTQSQAAANLTPREREVWMRVIRVTPYAPQRARSTRSAWQQPPLEVFG